MKAHRARSAADKIGVRMTKFYEMVNTGELPPATQISGNVKCWFDDDLDAFLARKRTESRAELGEAANV